jgi:ketosteroid isomerase-like protein
MKQLLFFCFILLFISACQAPAAQEEAIDMDQLRASLQAMEDAYAAGQKAKDAEAVAAYYADDAQSLSNDKPTAVGKAAIIESIKEGMASDTSGNVTRFEVVDVFASGNLAVEVGRSITANADGSETTGKYISVFEKRDGQYLCVRDIWNRDAPVKDDDDDNDDDDDE